SRSLPHSHTTATIAIHPLSLHDALPISAEFHDHAVVERPPRHLVGASFGAHHDLDRSVAVGRRVNARAALIAFGVGVERVAFLRSEEHTSELQSREKLVCRLLLEKKNNS